MAYRNHSAGRGGTRQPRRSCRSHPGQRATRYWRSPRDSHERPFTEQLDLDKTAGEVFLIVTNDPDERIVTLKAEPKYGRLLQHEHPSIPPGPTDQTLVTQHLAK
ncbi:hypothetical protein ACFVHS_43580 [Streptomyces sp. NPDC057746]|uniref:hypothetical protein n=1 Tax=Streptomyces sp. NPDC057746 TaxID=3346237 RepID=UPI00368F59E5